MIFQCFILHVTIELILKLFQNNFISRVTVVLYPPTHKYVPKYGVTSQNTTIELNQNNSILLVSVYVNSMINIVFEKCAINDT